MPHEVVAIEGLLDHDELELVELHEVIGVLQSVRGVRVRHEIGALGKRLSHRADVLDVRAWLAYDFGVKYIGHGWNTALGVAADLQLAAAFPDVDLVEFIGGSPYVDGITERPFSLDAEGNLEIPAMPGLGVALDRDKLARYTPDPSPLFA